jgi:hypothetical protein
MSLLDERRDHSKPQALRAKVRFGCGVRSQNALQQGQAKSLLTGLSNIGSAPPQMGEEQIGQEIAWKFAHDLCHWASLLSPRMSLREEPTFEVLFRVPPAHRLIVVRTRGRGGIVSSVYWEHEERDATGRLIARNDSFDEISVSGLRHTGWRKFDREGNLVSAGQIVP